MNLFTNRCSPVLDGSLIAVKTNCRLVSLYVFVSLKLPRSMSTKARRRTRLWDVCSGDTLRYSLPRGKCECHPDQKRTRSDDDRLIPFMNGSWLWSVTLEAFIRDFIKFRTLQFHNTTYISGQHSYTTCSVSSEHLYIPFYRTNIRKFSPTIIGYFWTIFPFPSALGLIKNYL